MLSIKTKGKKELTMSSRKSIFCMLYDRSRAGRLSDEQKVRVATAFETSQTTVKRVFRKAISNMEAHLESEETNINMEKLHLLSTHSLPLTEFPDHVFEPNKKGVVGRKRKYDRDALVELTENTPHNERGTYRNHASAVDVSAMTSWRMVNQEKVFEVVTANIKPSLTASNQYERFQWALSWIDDRSMYRNDRHDLVYEDLMDVVHVDEKWFDKEKVSRRVILTNREKRPHRTAKHKSHIEKVMFLCAQARPRYDPTRKYTWSGKLAMLPIGDYTVAKRNSIHFNKGDRKWENKTVDTETYLHLMETVVRNIAKEWPSGQWADPSFQVKIQHDGAPAHSSGEFYRGWHMMLGELYIEGVLPSVDKIILYKQPPNSPNTNVCDLGLFNAIQARYERLAPRDSVEIIDCVLKAWREFPWKRINNLFLTLQGVYNGIIDHHGGNDFKLPHMSKWKLDKMEQLPVSLKVSPDASWYLVAMDDPDFPEGVEFVDDDLPLPGTISRSEVEYLLQDAGEFSDED